MSEIKLEHVAKVYSNGVRAVDDFNMEISDKEFIVFVGPSGCGKSTTLRMIAGLEDITEGEISIDGKVVNGIEPKDRDIAMVFQNYALYPHMTVYDNMAFGLRLRKIPAPVIDKFGQTVYAVDTETIKKDKQKLAELKKYLAYYKRQKDEQNIDAVLREIEKVEDKIAADAEKIKADKVVFAEYLKVKAQLDEAFKKFGSGEENEEIKALKKEIEGFSETLVPATKLVHYTKQEIDRRITEAADILGLTEYLKRKPKAMSGGQRQRVALGRCIVREPKVFLLDEPLSNLDAKLRASMRVEISKLHNKLQTTFIYVTHDQIEAMTMGTRIVVMKDGVIQQIDSPKNLYNHPCNKFVAGFIGTPQMNFYKGEMNTDGKSVTIRFDDAAVEATVPAKYFEGIAEEYLKGEKKVIFGIRSEHLSVEDTSSPFVAKAKVSNVEELGVNSQVYVDFDLASEEKIDDSVTKGIIKAAPETEYAHGQIIDVAFDVNHLYIFDAETEKSIKS